LLDHNIDGQSGGLLAGSILLQGLGKGVRKCWRLLGVSPVDMFHLLVTSLLYLHPKSNPAEVEFGIWCEGCMRDNHYLGAIHAETAKIYGELRAYTNETFPKHFRNCPTAQTIQTGRFLTISEEKWMTEVLQHKILAYWPQGTAPPEDLEAEKCA
jgi:hypothetical protein